MEIQKIKALLQRYQTGNIAQSEKELVENWYSQLIDTAEWQWDEEEKELVQKMLEARIMNQVNDTQETAPARIHSLYRNRWRVAAAAAIFVVSGLSYFMLTNKTANPVQVAGILNDVKAPQSNKATVTLANGQQVYLDSINNGALATQGNVALIKLPTGELEYQAVSGEASGPMQYNTLSNPRGSQVVNMVLTDGTKVWLNAGSSMVYPVAFTSNERKVAVTGEAYFEVAHNAAKPFIVGKDAMEVRVLGTHFNINAYDDEDDIKVTLLEGSVKIKNGVTTALLHPGQQARVTNDIKLVSNVDMDGVMAWKNGFFQFDNASLQEVLKQLARWYDVEVVNEGQTKQREFIGEMERKLNLSQVLKLLEKNGVRFKTEGKKIIVLP